MSAAAMPGPHQLRGIATRIDTLSAVIEQLLVLLARERDALHTRREASALEQLAAEKHAGIEQASTVYERLRTDLAELYGTERPLADSIRALRTGQPALGAQLERLVELTRACKQANQDNGVLVSAGLRNARQAMDLLHGVPPGGEASGTYGPAGQTAARRQGNRVVLTA